MKKGTTLQLNEVFTAFTIDWILAKAILIYLDPYDCIRMEQLSKAWQLLCLQYWGKKNLGNHFIQKEEGQNIWLWKPKIERNHLSVDIIKIYYCVNDYIKHHTLSELSQTHLRSKWVARTMLDGKLTVFQAAARAQSAKVNFIVSSKAYYFQKLAIKLGVDPSIVLKENGEITGFGPFHIRLVEEKGAPPEKIAGLSPDEIKKLPELQSLFRL